MWRGLSLPWPLRSTSAWLVREEECKVTHCRPGPRVPRSTVPLCGWEGKSRHKRPVIAAEHEAALCRSIIRNLHSNRERHIHLSSFWTMWLCCDTEFRNVCYLWPKITSGFQFGIFELILLWEFIFTAKQRKWTDEQQLHVTAEKHLLSHSLTLRKKMKIAKTWNWKPTT